MISQQGKRYFNYLELNCKIRKLTIAEIRVS